MRTYMSFVQGVYDLAERAERLVNGCGLSHSGRVISSHLHKYTLVKKPKKVDYSAGAFTVPCCSPSRPSRQGSACQIVLSKGEQFSLTCSEL